MIDKCPLVSWQEENASESNGPHGHYEEEGVSLKELILLLIRGKKLIAMVTAAVLIVTVVGATIASNIHIGTKGTVQTAVQLYFSGIEVGKNPTGGNFDVNEIKSAEVLQSALDNIDFGSKNVSIDYLRSNISFQAVVPDSVAKTLENLKDIKDDQIKIDRLESLSGYSDIYIVKLNLADSVGIDEEQGRVLLDNIILEYKQQLIDKYAGNVVLADVFADNFSIKDYDYIQAANILNGQLDRMQSYVENHMPNTGVQSTVTGLNPADISSALESIRTVDMERIYTMIAAFYLTKDPNRVVAIYEQLVEDKEKAAAQYHEEAVAVKSVIANYKKDEQTIVLGDMGSDPINLTSENEQYNKFVTQYIEAGTNAVNATEDANYYREEAQRFKAALPLTAQNSEEAAKTEQSINLLQKKLVYWTGVINDTSKDYYSEATYQNYVEQLMPARSYASLEQGTSLVLIAAIGFVLGLVLGILIVLFRAYIKDEEKEVISNDAR